MIIPSMKGQWTALGLSSLGQRPSVLTHRIRLLASSIVEISLPGAPLLCSRSSREQRRPWRPRTSRRLSMGALGWLGISRSRPRIGTRSLASQTGQRGPMGPFRPPPSRRLSPPRAPRVAPGTWQSPRADSDGRGNRSSEFSRNRAATRAG